MTELGNSIRWDMGPEVKIISIPGKGLSRGLSKNFIPPMEVLGAVSYAASQGAVGPFVVMGGSVVYTLVGNEWNAQALGEGTLSKQ